MPVAVVTGATSGIGRWIALGLVRAGHRVVMVARDRTRGEAVQAWIHEHCSNAVTELLLADLSLLAATQEVGRRIAASHPAISLLVNNAGVFKVQREVTREGREAVLATNHLSPFVLTRALMPSLMAGTPSRIVNVGSSTSDRARIDPNDLELERRWGMVRAYSQSKLALLMATFTWARRLEGSGVVANVVHPGMVATGLVRAPGAIGFAWRAMAPMLLTEEQGAETPLYAALAPELGTVTGAYIKERRAVQPNRLVRDAGLVERVWRATERLIGGSRDAPPNRSAQDREGRSGFG